MSNLSNFFLSLVHHLHKRGHLFIAVRQLKKTSHILESLLVVFTPDSRVLRNLSRIALWIPYIYLKWNHSLKEIKGVAAGWMRDCVDTLSEISYRSYWV